MQHDRFSMKKTEPPQRITGALHEAALVEIHAAALGRVHGRRSAENQLEGEIHGEARANAKAKHSVAS